MLVEQWESCAESFRQRRPRRLVAHIGFVNPVAALDDFLGADDAASREFGRQHRSLTGKAGLHRPQIGRGANRHLATAADLGKRDPKGILDPLRIEAA